MTFTSSRRYVFCYILNPIFFPLPLKLRKSEIWDIALRAKSLTLGRIQTSLVLLSLIWDIRGLFSLIIMYTFKIKDYNDNKNN